MNKNIVAVSIFLFLYCNGVEMITEAQMKTAGKMIHNLCQKQTKVSKDVTEKTRSGEFVDDPKLKCYLKCVMEKLALMKNGRLDYDTAVEKIKKMPAKYVKPMSEVLETCRDAAKSSDPCEAAFETAKCMHKTNSEVYVLP